MAEISITFKAHGGFDAPWVVVRADSVDEVSGVVQELREVGAFSAVKQIAAEFRDAPTTDEAVAQVQKTLGGQEVAQPAQPARSETPVAGPPQQGLKCKTCGAPAQQKSGTSTRGKWAGIVCSTGDRDHTEWLKV